MVVPLPVVTGISVVLQQAPGPAHAPEPLLTYHRRKRRPKLSFFGALSLSYKVAANEQAGRKRESASSGSPVFDELSVACGNSALRRKGGRRIEKGA